MRFFVNDVLRCTLVHVGVRFHLKQKVQDVDQQQNLFLISRQYVPQDKGRLTILVPRLICSTALSALALSAKEAWNAVY